MHRFWIYSRLALPALALAATLAHAKWGVSPHGFSTGN
jgi:hypothetical protein